LLLRETRLGRVARLALRQLRFRARLRADQQPHFLRPLQFSGQQVVAGEVEVGRGDVHGQRGAVLLMQRGQVLAERAGQRVPVAIVHEPRA
jgi:hypothetical protein